MYYAIATVTIIVLELIYFFLAKKFHIVDRPNERSSHHRAVLLGAGIIFYLAILFYSLTHGMAYPYFLIGLSALAIVLPFAISFCSITINSDSLSGFGMVTNKSGKKVVRILLIAIVLSLPPPSVIIF